MKSVLLLMFTFASCLVLSNLVLPQAFAKSKYVHIWAVLRFPAFRAIRDSIFASQLVGEPSQDIHRH
jgi:hypothetical protein